MVFQAVNITGLGDRVANRAPRIERCKRVLEHHSDFQAQLFQVVGGGGENVVAGKQNLAAMRLCQADDRTADTCLAASGFADNAEHLALCEGEGDVFHGLDANCLAPAPQGVVRRQAAHVEKWRLGHGVTPRGKWHSAR